MEFNPTAKSKTQIANENKKDSSEEGANEGYSYVSGQANLKPKVLFYKHYQELQANPKRNGLNSENLKT